MQFPPYIESHPTLDSEVRDQYQKQISCIKQLLDIFEAPAYNEEDPEANKKVMDVMSEVCSFPPFPISPDKGY